jgi:hypothetical protein
MDEIRAAFEKKERNSSVMGEFGLRMKGLFNTAKTYRRAKELEWTESLRQYKGLYDPTVKIEANNSKVYPKITRSKVNIALSRLHEMLFPENDKNWAIEPTPEPRISKETVKAIALTMITKDETGNPVIPSAEDLRLQIKRFCDETCKAMTGEIEDQLIEMNYSEETKKVLRSGLMYGTGVMKGPMIMDRMKRRWHPVGGNEYEEKVTSDEVPFFEFVRIWDWYPDMTVTDLDKMSGSFQRHLMTKHDLRSLLKRGDFYNDILEEYMKAHPNGEYVPENWEVDLQVIEIEASKQTGYVRAGSTTDVNTGSTFRQPGAKYEVLEYWGYVDGNDLAACGVNIEDETLEYGANLWILGGKIIKAVLYDGALDKYKVFYYEKDETSLFGEGLCRIMRHSQIAISAGARMVLDNAACVSGPQVEVNWNLMTPDTDLNSFYPRKIWYREGRGIDAQYPAIRSIEFDSHIPELLSIIDKFREFGDEETTLPTWMIGQMVNNETAQATSGRMATITISIKDVVKNFDAFTEKIIRDLYTWNMEFNKRADIKGDYNVKPRGVSSLVMKEIRMNLLNQLQASMQPEDWDYIPRDQFVKEKIKTFDLAITMRTEEEAQKVREERENSRMQQLVYAQLEAEVQYKKAQTMAQLTKAKDKNVEAIKRAGEEPEGGEAVNEELQNAEVRAKTAESIKKEQEIGLAQQKHDQEMRQREQEHSIRMADQKLAALQAERKAKAELEMEKQRVDQEMKMKKEMHDVKKKVAAKPKPQKPQKTTK